MKWECNICGCKSDAIQSGCPNGCGDGSMTARQKLLELIRDKALSYGTFKMASGKTSNVMLDLSKALRTGDAQMLMSLCVKDILPNGVLIGGPVSGSDLVCSAIVRSGISTEWFGIRKESKGRGYDQGRITGNLSKGDHVWLIEDVCTSGGTMRQSAEVVLDYGAKIDGLFSLVNRGGLDVVGKELEVPFKFLYDLEEIKHGGIAQLV